MKTGMRRLALLLFLSVAIPAGPAIAGPVDDAKAFLGSGDVVSALKLLMPAAQSGDPAAQTMLGNLNRDGIGMPQNFSAAADWYRKAAGQGHPEANNALGVLHAEGVGVEKDERAALSYLLAAANSGDAEFQFRLGSYLDTGFAELGDKAAAAQWYAKAAAQNHVQATASLGLLYLEGSGVEKSGAKAVDLLEKAAEKGDAKAQNNLGLVYARGEAVEQDYDRAAALFARAAEQGLAPAMTNLGVMYDNGFGVPQSDEKAIELYRMAGRQGDKTGSKVLNSAGVFYDSRLMKLSEKAKAEDFQIGSENGDPVAMFLRGYLIFNTNQPARDLSAAAGLFEQAAEKGLSAAMANLGLLYYRGQGVPQDHVMAYVWLNRAAAAGFAEAIGPRDEVAASMSSGQLNEAQALTLDQ